MNRTDTMKEPIVLSALILPFLFGAFTGPELVNHANDNSNTSVVTEGVIHNDRRNQDHYFLQQGDAVMLLGNSITAWAQPMINHLKADIQKQYPQLLEGPNAVTFVTAGINGEQAFEGLKRLPDLLRTHKPTLCVINYGTCEVTFKNHQSYDPAMQAILDELARHGVAVTIVSPPICSASNWKQGDNWPASQFLDGLPRMQKKARKMAKKNRVLFADAYTPMEKHVKATGDELTTDGIHLNDLGYRVMADAIQAAWRYGQPINSGSRQ